MRLLEDTLINTTMPKYLSSDISAYTLLEDLLTTDRVKQHSIDNARQQCHQWCSCDHNSIVSRQTNYKNCTAQADLLQQHALLTLNAVKMSVSTNAIYICARAYAVHDL
jgi:hypothetical protein